MAKRESGKKWQKNNPDKIKDYQNNYMVDKKVVRLVLDAELTRAIEKVKPESSSWAGWITNFLAEKITHEIPSDGS